MFNGLIGCGELCSSSLVLFGIQIQLCYLSDASVYQITLYLACCMFPCRYLGIFNNLIVKVLIFIRTMLGKKCILKVFWASQKHNSHRFNVKVEK